MIGIRWIEVVAQVDERLLEAAGVCARSGAVRRVARTSACAVGVEAEVDEVEQARSVGVIWLHLRIGEDGFERVAGFGEALRAASA